MTGRAIASRATWVIVGAALGAGMQLTWTHRNPKAEAPPSEGKHGSPAGTVATAGIRTG